MHKKKNENSTLINFFINTENEMVFLAQNMQKLTQKKKDRLIQDHLFFLENVKDLTGTWETFSIDGGFNIGVFSFKKEPDQKIIKSQANFSSTNISGLDFKDLTLPNTQWIGCWADHINFCNSILTRSCFIDSNLESAIFTKADLTKCDFSRAYLAGANFTGANLSGADFEDCDLSSADFTNAKISNASFEGANLDGVIGLK